MLKGMLLRHAPRRSRPRQLRGRAASAVGANAEVAVSDVVGCVANLVEDTHSADEPRVRRLKAPHAIHPVYMRASRNPKVVELLTDLWGSLRYDSGKLNMKSAGYGAPIEWHQDWAFYPHTNEDLAAVGIMIDDVDMENGPMIVPGAAFDDVMRRLALAGMSGAARDEALAIIAEAGVEKVARTPFTAPTGRVGGILKSTAFKLHCPVEAYCFRPKGIPERGAWAWLRELTAARPDLVAVPFKGRVWALAALTAIQEVFGDGMIENPVRAPLDVGELRHEDGAITHLLVRGLAGAIAGARNLPSDGALLWNPAKAQDRRLGGATFKVHDAVLIYIRRVSRDNVVVLKPTVKVFTAAGAAVAKEDEKAIKIGIFGYQHNDKFNDAVEGWRRVLFGPGVKFSCPAGEDTGLNFTIDRSPISAAILAGSGEAVLPDAASAKATQRGFKVREPLRSGALLRTRSGLEANQAGYFGDGSLVGLQTVL